MKEKFDIIFVVLVYRNVSDLRDFFIHLSVENSKVIVVNSFYDNDSEAAFKEIADFNSADFLSIENKGYGFGNNRGTEYAMRHYDFNYLIISNADIEIRKFSIDSLNNNTITAPKILNKRGRNQNPFIPYEVNWIIKLLNFFYKYDYKKSLYIVFAIRKFFLIYWRLMHSLFGLMDTFSAHGSFVIIPQKLVERLYPFYNERMFLLGEEEHLAKKAKIAGVKTEYNSNIIIHHKEDGSMGFLGSTYKIGKESFLIFYEYWYKK